MNNSFCFLIVCLIGGLVSACSQAEPETPPPATQTPFFTATTTYTPSPTFTPTITPTPVLPFEGKLAYASDQDGDYEIFVITAQSGTPKQLTHNDAEDRHPAISPDGNHIAYVSKIDGRFKLFIMDQDGSNFTLAYEDTELNIYDPKWSPDGTEIVACIGNREPETKVCDIYSINLASGEATQETNQGFAICPEWSPDGEKLAFLSDYGGRSTIFIAEAAGVRIFNPVTSDQRYLCPHWMPPSGKDLLALMGITDRVLVSTAYRDTETSIMLATDLGRKEKIPTLFQNLAEATGWTLDGRGIIVERFDSETLTSTDIYIAQFHINLVLTEENLIQLTDTEGVDETDSTWGP